MDFTGILIFCRRDFVNTVFCLNKGRRFYVKIATFIVNFLNTKALNVIGVIFEISLKRLFGKGYLLEMI
jgi:hypothetical protein